ncbi:unnamed protein product [Moneuplotes crassus]|uniref:FAD/NAD(P)-binding domain-containing protein n=1 Tax=Euplotes crassus TaxID=5936 RepID=A0AAD1XEW6_EUPCR|nr:unnamed protein product [Moneuplotes crassus]
MGNSQPQRKKLVIIGGSFAGLLILDKVKEDFDITLIEKKDHFEWICSLPHSMVDLDYFENEATVDLKQCISVDRVFGPNVEYLQGMVTEIADDHSLKYKPTEGLDSDQGLQDIEEETCQFDLLIICTGSVYKINEKSAKDAATIFSIKERTRLIKKYHDRIDSAKEIRVVGGGSTGVESLGEIINKYGDEKEYSMITNQDRLLHGFPEGLSRRASDYFTGKRTFKDLHLNQYFSPENNESEDHNFSLMCAGIDYYTPFMNFNFKDCVDQRRRIFVNQYFQVTNQDPTQQEIVHPKTYDNIFCYGDACLSCMQEVKNVPAIRETSYTVKKNLLAIAYGGKLTKMSYAVDQVAAVYYSKWRGSLVLNDLAIPNCATLLAKKSIEKTFMSKFKNKCCGKFRFCIYNYQVNFSSCYLNTCCCCCPCSKRRRYKERRAALRALIAQHNSEEEKYPLFKDGQEERMIELKSK